LQVWEEVLIAKNHQTQFAFLKVIYFVFLLLMMTTEISSGIPEQPNADVTPQAYLPFVARPALFVKTATSPFYLQNYANNAGCDWMGIAGEVLDLERAPVSTGAYVVHIWGSGIDSRVTVGSAPALSPAGWEQFLFDSPVIRDYEIQLETASGTAVSPIYAIQTRASCNENLVRFDFIQN
jgi:hypothetical protein